MDPGRRDRDDDKRQDIRRFREELDLPVTDALVDYFLSGVRGADQFEGLWLTPEEEDWFFPTQARLTEASKLVGEYSDQHPDTFAGTWVEWRDDGKIHVSFTDRIEEHRRTLRAVIPHPDMLRVHPAEHSLAALKAIQYRISDDDDEALRAVGIEVDSSFIDEEENRLHVEVVAKDAEAARAFFRGRYGERVVVDVFDDPSRGVRRV